MKPTTLTTEEIVEDIIIHIKWYLGLEIDSLEEKEGDLSKEYKKELYDKIVEGLK